MRRQRPERAEALRLRAQGVAVRAIARELGVPRGTVRTWCEGRRGLGSAKALTACRLYDRGLQNHALIARELGVSRTAVRITLGSDRPSAPGRRGRPRKWETYRAGMFALRDIGKTTTEIARILGIPVQSVANYLKEPRRSSSAVSPPPGNPNSPTTGSPSREPDPPEGNRQHRHAVPYPIAGEGRPETRTTTSNEGRT